MIKFDTKYKIMVISMTQSNAILYYYIGNLESQSPQLLHTLNKFNYINARFGNRMVGFNSSNSDLPKDISYS